MHNEMGLLARNGSAAVHVGRIATASVTGSYFHHTDLEHLLKSRAAANQFVDNRSISCTSKMVNHELKFPDGGVVFVVCNIISQGLNTGSQKLISFDAEGYKMQSSEIHLEGKTLVNPLPWGGLFLWVVSGADAIGAANYRWVGQGKLESAGPGEHKNNAKINLRDYAREPGGTGPGLRAMQRQTKCLVHHLQKIQE